MRDNRRADIGRSPGRGAAVVMVAVASIVPLFYLGLLSFSERWVYPDLVPSAVTPGRWLQLLSGRGELARSMLLSVLISATVAFFATCGGFIASRYVAYHERRRLLLLPAYLPFAMSPVILGTCIHVLYIRIGLAGSIAGVVFAQLIFTLGFALIFCMSFWNRERRELEGVAALLGGSTRQIYARVLMPAARGMLLICFLQTFLFSWFQYGITLLIGAGKVQTLTMLVFMYIGEANIYHAAVSSVLLTLPPVLMLWAGRRFVYGTPVR